MHLVGQQLLNCRLLQVVARSWSQSPLCLSVRKRRAMQGDRPWRHDLTWRTVTFGTRQWASASPGIWCNSDLGPMLYPLSRAALLGRPSRATFASALFVIHELWAMSSIVCLIAPLSVGSGPSFLAFTKMLRGACVCSCGTGTRNLSAVVSLPCCKRPEICLPLSHCLAGA